LTVNQQDYAGISLPFDLGEQPLPGGIQKPLLQHRLQRGHHEEDPNDVAKIHL
jgi:hypothetical protein